MQIYIFYSLRAGLVTTDKLNKQINKHMNKPSCLCWRATPSSYTQDVVCDMSPQWRANLF